MTHSLKLHSTYAHEDRNGREEITTWQYNNTKSTVDYLFHCPKYAYIPQGRLCFSFPTAMCVAQAGGGVAAGAAPAALPRAPRRLAQQMARLRPRSTRRSIRLRGISRLIATNTFSNRTCRTVLCA